VDTDHVKVVISQGHIVYKSQWAK